VVSVRQGYDLLPQEVSESCSSESAKLKAQSNVCALSVYQAYRIRHTSLEFYQGYPQVFQKMRTKERIIGLTGTNGSGKGEAAQFFMSHGYAYLSLSDLIREELRQNNQDVSRDNLIKMGNHLRKTFGADILARRTMEEVRGKTIIDSIRNPNEVEFLQSHKEFLLLAVDAPPGIRYARVMNRGRDESAQTLEEFVAKEQEEMSESDKGQQLQRCMQMADHLILNDGTLDEFHRKLEAFL
jgi:dephospho-CoA kinase